MADKRLQGLDGVAYCTRMKFFAALRAGICLSLFGFSAAPAHALALTECRLEHPQGVVSFAAQCGSLSVAENPALPTGRRIDLHIARIPAINRRKAADPLFLIAGGPGGSAITMYTSAAPAFERVRRERDIVLVDQRGTGRSHALHCELDESALFDASTAQIIAETGRCLNELKSRADVAQYTTSVAVGDLDTVRAKLGYAQINLYGVSYGTRVAQHYARRFPQRVRTLILDGVVPMDLALGPNLALDAERALLATLKRCNQERGCQAQFGDPVATYRALFATLQKKAVAVSLAHPRTGKRQQVAFSATHLAMVLRLALYDPAQTALLPLALHQAHALQDYSPLASQFLLMNDAFIDLLAYGMHNTVVCSEDVAFYPTLKQIDRTALERTFLGTTQVDALRDICKLWPTGPVDKDLRLPLRSNIPTLLLSGAVDPVTPQAYAEQARTKLSNSLHLVLDGMSHGQLATPCIDTVFAKFMESGTVQNLDTRCLQRTAPVPFFTTLAGPDA
jgi:pimeloyl-ACP methyl ester carboxylesterase